MSRSPPWSLADNSALHYILLVSEGVSWPERLRFFNSICDARERPRRSLASLKKQASRWGLIAADGRETSFAATLPQIDFGSNTLQAQQTHNDSGQIPVLWDNGQWHQPQINPPLPVMLEAYEPQSDQPIPQDFGENPESYYIPGQEVTHGVLHSSEIVGNPQYNGHLNPHAPEYVSTVPQGSHWAQVQYNGTVANWQPNLPVYGVGRGDVDRQSGEASMAITPESDTKSEQSACN